MKLTLLVVRWNIQLGLTIAEWFKFHLSLSVGAGRTGYRDGALIVQLALFGYTLYLNLARSSQSLMAYKGVKVWHISRTSKSWLEFQSLLARCKRWRREAESAARRRSKQRLVRLRGVTT